MNQSVECTSFSRQELAELRKRLIKGELTDVEWLVKIYELGGDTSMLSADELTVVIDAIQSAKLKTALKEIAEQHSNSKIIMELDRRCVEKSIPSSGPVFRTVVRTRGSLTQLQTQLRKWVILTSLSKPDGSSPWENSEVEG